MPRRKKRSSSNVPGILAEDGLGTKLYFQSVINRPEECDLSLEEARWRHYLDTGRVSFPETEIAAPTLASTSSAPFDSTLAPDPGARRDESRVPPGPMMADSGSATTTTTCSLCAARLATSERVRGENDDDGSSRVALQDEDSDDESAAPSDSYRRRHRRRADGERVRKQADRRLRQVEKTIEALSHGLILALTQPKSVSGADVPAETNWATHPSPRGFDEDQFEETGLDEAAEALSTTLAGMGLSEDAREGVGIPGSKRSHTASKSQEDDNGASDSTATESYKSLFTSKDRSPISGMLESILKFITSSDMFEFLKQAEVHGGLRSTQMFDLSWVLHNFFNIHGGILIHCLQRSLTTMNGISQSLGSDVWSRDPVLFRKLDEVYLRELRPHIRTDGDYDLAGSASWKSYCLELAVIFSEHFPNWRSARYFRDLSESYQGCFNPVITASYIEDLTMLWTGVHPALLEVTRWFEPFIDYGSDFNRETPFYDATIALRCRVRELLSRNGVKEPDVSERVVSLLEFLRKNRSQALTKMQGEMDTLMDSISRDFDASEDFDEKPTPSTETDSDPPPSAEDVLVEQMDRATGCRLVDRTRWTCSWRALALHEIRVMKSYRPRLLSAGTAFAGVRAGVFHVLVHPGGLARGAPLSEKGVFWDGIV